jgi:hypothetical protein
MNFDVLDLQPRLGRIAGTVAPRWITMDRIFNTGPMIGRGKVVGSDALTIA